jgi:hypothetical protein
MKGLSLSSGNESTGSGDSHLRRFQRRNGVSEGSIEILDILVHPWLGQCRAATFAASTNPVVRARRVVAANQAQISPWQRKCCQALRKSVLASAQIAANRCAKVSAKLVQMLVPFAMQIAAKAVTNP